MRFSVLALAGVVGLAAAQSVPACLTTCISNNFAASGCSSATDVSCLCRSTAFISAVTTCVTTSCTGSDLIAAATAAQSQCASVTGAGASAAASVTSEAASVVSSASSSAARVTSSASSVVSSAASSASRSSAAANSASMSASMSSARPSVSTTTGAGNKLVVQGGVLGAVLAAVVAL